MKIYLDACSLQRPLDTKTQIRITLEAEAILGILALCESGNAELISSDALVFETERIPNMVRKACALAALQHAKTFAALNDSIKKRAGKLNSIGLKPLDALHLASAEESQADYFCTCDDKLLKKARTIQGLKTKVVSPIELAEEVEK